MATYCTIFIVDDHLGLIEGRTANQEAEFINTKLSEIEYQVVSEPFKFIPEGNCIVGQIKYRPSSEHKEVFKYDYVYYRADSDGPLVLYKL